MRRSFSFFGTIRMFIRHLFVTNIIKKRGWFLRAEPIKMEDEMVKACDKIFKKWRRNKR